MPSPFKKRSAVQGALIGLCLYLLVLGVMLPRLVSPYSPHNPKKVYLHHTHHLVGGEGGLSVNHSTWDVVAIDSVRSGRLCQRALQGSLSWCLMGQRT